MTAVPRRATACAALLIGVVLVALAPFGTGPASAVADPSPAAAETAWTWPVGPPVVMLEPFRAPPTPYAAGHRGVDLAASPGDTVRAPAGGVVSFAGPVAGRPVLSIDHGDGVVSSIEPVNSSVAAGAVVGEGEPVGAVGTGGHCDGACVHFGVRAHGQYVSPLLFLGGVPRAVLLPLGG
jgi:murein DD-endopeptidase MepM/ murein hydrolase activator NlpD